MQNSTTRVRHTHSRVNRFMRGLVAATGLVVVAACRGPDPVKGAGPPWLCPGTTACSRELEQIFRDDQVDRTPPVGRELTQAEFLEVGARDLARLKQVKDIYHRNELKQPLDFFHAAVILQHSWDSTSAGDDHLLAHELAIIAFANGVPGAGYLVAASEDRFLQDDLGRRQRFGTQSDPRAPLNVDSVITDSLRARFGVPALEQLKARGRP